MAPASSRLLTIGAAVGSLGLLTAVILMLWPADPTDYGITTGRDQREQADGETVGWVSKVESNTIHVNSGPFGGGVVPLVITKNTKITVGNKEGWFEDIRPGGQVRVAYELYQGKRLARTVELLVDEGTRRPVRSEPRLKSAVGTPEAERVPTKAAASTRSTDATRPTAPQAIEPAPPPKPAAAVKPAPPPPHEAQPAVKAEPARAQAVEAQPASRPARTEAATRAQESVKQSEARPAVAPSPPATPPARSRVPEPARASSEGEGTDGSAAVDWLLNNRK
ncbi:MAG TPA: hypothetical protein VJX92_06820 [Methylomirabilota bacterium]|nr:hypothetical protein [Methylomirabilota bacterium]